MACPFCDIIAETAPASFVYSDDDCVAFLDLAAINPGHTLIVPREHAVGLQDLPLETGAALWKAGHHIGRGLRHGAIPCDGINLLLADGAAAWQSVFHVHLHVIPRLASDSFTLSAKRHRHGRDELDETAATLINGLPPLP